ncbi:M10 family metallopeptidase C-terminal domain-containing protein [Pseudomonas sp. 18175]|uniref:M10 family metallopeptidase C-terminal domain-containing protein n=1 Tax=Pseudomonas sp. 18175 TaxID=3390056 RepID=UPI003D1A1C4B
MSTIPTTQHRSPALHTSLNGATPNVTPSLEAISPEALNALLRPQADPPRKAKLPEPAPDFALLEQDLDSLASRVGKDSIAALIRDPSAQTSTDLRNTLTHVLTADKINALLSHPNAQACSKTLTEITTHLNQEALDAVLTPHEEEQVDAYRKYVEAELFNLKYRLSSAPASSRFNLIRASIDQKHHYLTDIQQHLNVVAQRATCLYDIATLAKNANEPLKYLHPDDWDRRRDESQNVPSPAIFRYNHTSESTLDAPSEIKNFVHGRDKLDVSGISKQLNKALQWVNQLSGASGEIQLNYSPDHNASVLVISGNKGQPAFVARIEGRLKETDLVT